MPETGAASEFVGPRTVAVRTIVEVGGGGLPSRSDDNAEDDFAGESSEVTRVTVAVIPDHASKTFMPATPDGMARRPWGDGASRAACTPAVRPQLLVLLVPVGRRPEEC